MDLYDTHCHFETEDPAAIAAILQRAQAAGVRKLMAVGGSAALNNAAVAAAQVAVTMDDAPQVVVALGHERDQTGRPPPDLAALAGGAPSGALRACGEIGLDYHYAPGNRAAQLKLFGEQLEDARRHDLPVVVHTREADADTVALLREIPSRGVIHCYTGTPEYAKRFLDLGFFISFSGIITFRAADNVRAAARVVPDDRILIETDSPFLAPVPMRGQPNEPAFIRHTCAFLAAQRGRPAEDFAALTFANAERLLGGSSPGWRPLPTGAESRDAADGARPAPNPGHLP